MPLKITDPSKQVAVLNKWADGIEQQLKDQNKLSKVALQTAATGGSGGGTGTGGLSEVDLSMPEQFEVTSSTAGGIETIDVAWEPETASTFLGADTNIAIPAPDGTVGSANATAGPLALSITAKRSSFILNISAVEGTHDTSTAGLVPSTGSWTSLSLSSHTWGGYTSASADGVVSVAPYYTTNSANDAAIASTLIEFGAVGTPVVTQPFGTSSGAGTSFAVTGTVPSNCILIGILTTTGTLGGVLNFGDSKGQQWTRLADFKSGTVNNPGTDGANVSVWFCGSPATGSTTVTASTSFVSGATLKILCVTNLAASLGLPYFRFISYNDIIGGGIVKIANGGTGANMNATGGGHNYVNQFSTGGAFSTKQPDYDDILGATGIFPTQFNGVGLVGHGIPSEIADVSLTAQTAAIAATNLYSALPNTAYYRVSWYAKVTTVSDGSSTLGGSTGFQLQFTDGNDSVVVTTPTWWDGGNNGSAPSSASLNTTQTVISGSYVFYGKLNTAVKYIMGYTDSHTSFAMQYSLHIRLEAL